MARACPRGAICVDMAVVVAFAALAITAFVAFYPRRPDPIAPPPETTTRVSVQVAPPKEPMAPPLASTFLMPINTPTQGVAAEYQPVGTLTSDDGSVLPLVGKPLIPGRDKWSYFTSADNYAQVRLPVMYKGKNCMDEYGCDELSSGDSVSTSGGPGDMKVSLYPRQYPRYIPL